VQQSSRVLPSLPVVDIGEPGSPHTSMLCIHTSGRVPVGAGLAWAPSRNMVIEGSRNVPYQLARAAGGVIIIRLHLHSHLHLQSG